MNTSSAKLDPGRVIVRRATACDAEGILACLAAAFEPYRPRYTPAAFADTTLDERSVHERLREMYVLVAVADGVVVGTVAGAVTGREGHLRGMAVLPSYSGTGLASRLLEAIEGELRFRRCTRVTLDTTQPLHRAMRFYERCGYHRTSRVTDFFGMQLIEHAKEF
jgi:GNAT superfamily N-acetyltransferase